jgi:thioredoxin reductase
VFAVDDVRGNNIKRVESAVGEGSIAVAVTRSSSASDPSSAVD